MDSVNRLSDFQTKTTLETRPGVRRQTRDKPTSLTATRSKLFSCSQMENVFISENCKCCAVYQMADAFYLAKMANDPQFTNGRCFFSCQGKGFSSQTWERGPIEEVTLHKCPQTACTLSYACLSHFVAFLLKWLSLPADGTAVIQQFSSIGVAHKALKILCTLWLPFRQTWREKQLSNCSKCHDNSRLKSAGIF